MATIPTNIQDAVSNGSGNGMYIGMDVNFWWKFLLDSKKKKHTRCSMEFTLSVCCWLVFSIYQGRQWGILYQSSWPPRWRYRSPCTAPWNQPQPLFPNWSSEMSLPCLFSDSPDRLSNRSISRSANRINVLYITFYTRKVITRNGFQRINGTDRRLKLNILFNPFKIVLISKKKKKGFNLKYRSISIFSSSFKFIFCEKLED